jgi:hypothetical protein
MERNQLSLWRDESGVVVSAELVIILTVMVLGLIVGLVQVQSAVVTELQGTAAGLSSLNQSFAFTGFHGCQKANFRTSWTSGSFFIDTFGTCVGTAGATTTCEIFAGASTVMAPPVVSETVVPDCPTCVPDGPVLPEPCLTCPPATGTISPGLPPAPRPEIPLGPVPQNLPQQ